MTPTENAEAQQKALEALIAASLRSPDTETEVTEEDISRFVDQRVTLSSEDKAALEKSKPQVMRAIREILQGNEQANRNCFTRPSKAEHKQFAAMNRNNAKNEFSELTDSELDRKRRDMIERIKKKRSGSTS